MGGSKRKGGTFPFFCGGGCGGAKQAGQPGRRDAQPRGQGRQQGRTVLQPGARPQKGFVSEPVKMTKQEIDALRKKKGQTGNKDKSAKTGTRVRVQSPRCSGTTCDCQCLDPWTCFWISQTDPEPIVEGGAAVVGAVAEGGAAVGEAIATGAESAGGC